MFLVSQIGAIYRRYVRRHRGAVSVLPEPIGSAVVILDVPQHPRTAILDVPVHPRTVIVDVRKVQ